MTTQLPSIRLRPTESQFLNTQGFSSGVVFYNAEKNTLTVMDGNTNGGFELLRADLSNIAGGGGGAGVVDFGSRILKAQSFQGDGSLLTNLPIPPDLVSTTDLTTAINNAVGLGYSGEFAFYPADGNSIGSTGTNMKWDQLTNTLSVTNLAVTGNLLASITLTSLGFPTGVVVNEFSTDGTLADNSDSAVPTERATKTYIDTALSNLDLTASGQVNLGTGGRLAFYSTDSQAVNSTSTDLTWDNVDGLLTVRSISSPTMSGTTATFTTSNTTTLNATTINTSNIINSGTGVPRWTSGSDFIIDAAGVVNVVGSKITNVATPTQATDAANKAYVDGAASAFDGGTVTGTINITNNTASTSSTTGALKVAGGVGVGGDMYSQGLIYVWDTGTSSYTPVLTSASGGYNGGIISGTVFVNNSTTSSSATTGALRVLGGVGIQGTLTTGPDAYHNGIRFGRGAASSLGSNTNVAIGGGTANDAPLALNSTGINLVAIGYKALSGISSSSDNTAVGYNAGGGKLGGNSNTIVGSNAGSSGSGSSNTIVGAGAMFISTGDTGTAIGHDALHQVDGSGNIGIGYIAGQQLLTGNYNVIIGSNTGDSIDGTSNNILICDGSGTIRIQVLPTGEVTIPVGIASTNTTTGAFQVAGGVGITGAINAGGAIKTTDATVSTSTTTGSITTAGGVGVVGDVYANAFYGNGAGLTGVVTNTWAGGTVANASNFTNTTASTSTTTGAVRIAGGLGVAGRVSASNFNGVTVPASGSAPGTNAFVRTDASGYVYTGYINATHGTEAVTLGSVIVSNSTDSFYRRVTPANFKTYIGVSSILGTPASLYGAVAIQGEKNGWSGISIRNNAGGLCGTLMMSSGQQGFYNAADNNWIMYWDQAGNLVANGNVSAYSDERLKDNIKIIPDALGKVLKLDGVTFIRKDSGEVGTGLIAQQLQKVLPEAVHEDKDGMLSVAYGNTVGLLIEAMKEQQRQIEELRAEITALKGK
jgi:hypothetical protein